MAGRTRLIRVVETVAVLAVIAIHEGSSGSSVYRQFVQVTDFHVDQLYTPGTDTLTGLCQPGPQVGEGGAGPHGSFDCDAPKSLVRSAIDYMKRVVPNPDFILWTGDNSPHLHKQTDWDTVYSNLRFVTKHLYKSFPDTRVVPALGNHESSPANHFGDPAVDPAWSGGRYRKYLTQGSFNDLIKERAAADKFSECGFYAVRDRSLYKELGVVQTFLVLNTNLYLSPNRTSDPCGQLQWLRGEVEASASRGENVFVLGHIPPGFFEFNPIRPFFASDAITKEFVNIVTEEANSQKVVAHFYGHTHTSSFRLLLDHKGKGVKGVVFICPSVTPQVYHGEIGTNPSFRVYDYDVVGRKVVGFKQYYLPLDEISKEGRRRDLQPEYGSDYSYDDGEPNDVDEWTFDDDDDDVDDDDEADDDKGEDGGRGGKAGRSSGGGRRVVNGQEFVVGPNKDGGSIAGSKLNRSLRKRAAGGDPEGTSRPEGVHPTPDAPPTGLDIFSNTSQDVVPLTTTTPSPDDKDPGTGVNDKEAVLEGSSEDKNASTSESAISATTGAPDALDDEAPTTTMAKVNNEDPDDALEGLADRWRLAFDGRADLMVPDMSAESMYLAYLDMRNNPLGTTFDLFCRDATVLHKNPGLCANKTIHAKVVCVIVSQLEEELVECMQEFGVSAAAAAAAAAAATSPTKAGVEVSDRPSPLDVNMWAAADQGVVVLGNEAGNDLGEQQPKAAFGAGIFVCVVAVVMLAVLGAVAYRKRRRRNLYRSQEFLLTDNVFKYDGYSPLSGFS